MPLNAGSYHFAVGPLIALLVVGLLALALRWTFGGGSAPAAGRSSKTDNPYGLLVEIAVTPTTGQANALRAVLSDAGIRSTAALVAARRFSGARTVEPGGRVAVMVFPADAERAGALAAQTHFGDG